MKAGRLLFALLLVGAASVLALCLGRGVETDLYGLAEGPQASVFREIAAAQAHQGRILVEGPDEAAALAVARAVAETLDVPPPPAAKEMLAFLAAHRAGLLAAETREKLLAGCYDDVADRAAARLFGLGPALFSVKDDPFQLMSDYVEQFAGQMVPGWTLKDGFLVRPTATGLQALASWNLASPAAARLVATLDRVAAFNAGAADFGQKAGHGIVVSCAGPPFHAAETSERAKREINLLSAVSLVCVVLLGVLLFRSGRFVPELVLAQGAAFLVAAAALFGCFARPHVLTFVFGTSLIGLSVDYVYHTRVAGGAAHVRRPLFHALLTTVAAFVPLFFASATILRQMAVFTVAGLVTAGFFVQIWGPVPKPGEGPVPKLGGGPVPKLGGGPVPKPGETGGVWACVWPWLVVLAGLVALVGLPRLTCTTAPKAFYRPSAQLAAAEARLLAAAPGAKGAFVFVPGKTLQDALEHEERLGVKGLSALVPSLKRQQENARLVARLYAAAGKRLTAKTGIPVPDRPPAAAFLDPSEAWPACFDEWVRAMRVTGGLVSPCPPQGRTAEGTGAQVIRPQTMLEELFASFTRETEKLLAGSFLGLVILLALVFRRRFLAHVLPILMAFLATAGTLGWLGVPITFFTLLCFFVLVGLGLDYVIFHLGSSVRTTARAVRCSFLTSFVGLGALALTHFEVTRQMGLTFAVGLAWAYLFARVAGVWAARPGAPCARPAAWHEQREQSAGALRIQLLWLVYRFLGKNVLKIVCVPVMACIYPFAGPARRALAQFYRVFSPRADVPPFRIFRHLLGFAWSLVDKTDACTLRKNLPRMAVRDDAGWRSLQACLARRQGAFLLSTHVGTIEVLPALYSQLASLSASAPARPPRVHAFQQMGHDAVFTRAFMRHFDATHLTLHAVEDIGVETAVAMQEAIRRGELVLMAGDRLSAGSSKTLNHDFLGRTCRWPKGVFVFARLLEAPIYFVTCVRTGWNAYEVHVEEGSAGGRAETSDLLARYAAFLERETRAHPEQWYQFYDFFSKIEN